uniref:Uncharacterized protein n=1 Tax=Schmidtea mediterranea TaxID=79327 RepID=I1ZI97_SCHMD|nr:hypothetical protein [Schmidtea mediterranea]
MSYQKTVPRSLNYITVMENNCSSPLSIYPPSECSYLEPDTNESFRKIKSHNFKHNLTTPQSSPVVDYCQIDLNCTYALKAIDHLLYHDKIKYRDKDSILKSGSPEDVESCMNFDQSENFSISSFNRERKNKMSTNKKVFRRLFSRKAESTN